MNDRSATGRKGPAGPDWASPRRQIAEAYDACAAGLYRYALMILADPGAAEDALQQAFTKLVSMGDRIGEIGFCEGYLRKAIRNECYNILSRKRRRDEYESGSAQFLVTAEAENAKPDKEQQHAVENALRALPADQREVVHMKVYEKMTFRQIAESLGVSINTAASRYRYAMDKLRGLLAPLGRNEDL